jgi:hypothetical protein
MEDGDEGHCYEEITEFETKEEAQEVIDKLESETYYLSHGEASRPNYEIIEDFNYGPDCKTGNYENSVAIEEIPAEIISELENSNVEYEGDYDSEYDEYSSYVTIEDETGDEWIYGIHYTVSTTATQLHADDLGNINWDHAVFTKEIR